MNDKIVNFLKQPQLYFIIFSVVVVVYGLMNDTPVLDINVHDTYLVVGYFHFTFIPIIYSLAMALTYYLMSRKRKLRRGLSQLHTIVTLNCFVILMGVYWFPSYYEYKPYRDYSQIGYIEQIMIYQNIGIGSFVIAQILLIINLILKPKDN